MTESLYEPSRGTVVHQRRNFLADVTIRLVREKPLGTFGLVIILLLLLTAVFADVIAPYGFSEMTLRDRLTGYSADHWLGTDHVGRDVFSRIIYGARISLYVGLSASAIQVVIAAIIGITSAYIGGNFDLILQRFVDAFNAFPDLIILLCIVSIVGPGMWQIIIVLGILGGVGRSRLVRSAVFAIKENVYMEAGRAIGSTTLWMLIRHALPNVAPILLVMFSISISGNILAEAGLSFLGYGIPPPTPSWGGMLSQAGRQYMRQAPWLSIWPGVALTLTVYSVNVWGDAIRDLLDPKLRGGVGTYNVRKVKRGRLLARVRTKAGS